MVNNTASYMKHSHFTNTSILNQSDKCAFFKSLNDNSNNQLNGEFFWDKKQQGIILSAFFYGYILTQVINKNYTLNFETSFDEKKI